MFVIISVLLLTVFLISAAFTDSALLPCIIGVALSCAGILIHTLLKSKLGKTVRTACGVLISVCCIVLCLFTASSSAEGTKLQRAELLQTVRSVAASGDADKLESVYIPFTEKYGETDDVRLLAAECYLTSADKLNGIEESRDRQKKYREIAANLLRNIKVKTSMDYYMTNGHYLQSQPAAFVRVNNWLDTVKQYPMWDTAHLMVAISLRSDGSTDYTMIQYYTGMALQINPNNALALAYMGVVQYELGMYDSALYYLEKAAEIGEDNSQVVFLVKYYEQLIEEAKK